MYLLGGSWVVISRVISRVTIPITHIRGLITPLKTTHEPPIMERKATRSRPPYHAVFTEQCDSQWATDVRAPSVWDRLSLKLSRLALHLGTSLVTV